MGINAIYGWKTKENYDRLGLGNSRGSLKQANSNSKRIVSSCRICQKAPKFKFYHYKFWCFRGSPPYSEHLNQMDTEKWIRLEIIEILGFNWKVETVLKTLTLGHDLTLNMFTSERRTQQKFTELKWEKRPRQKKYWGIKWQGSNFFLINFWEKE